MDLDPASWGGLELGLNIVPVKTSSPRPPPNALTSFVSTVDEDIALQRECGHLCNASNSFAQQGKSFIYRFS